MPCVFLPLCISFSSLSNTAIRFSSHRRPFLKGLTVSIPQKNISYNKNKTEKSPCRKQKRLNRRKKRKPRVHSKLPFYPDILSGQAVISPDSFQPSFFPVLQSFSSSYAPNGHRLFRRRKPVFHRPCFLYRLYSSTGSA